MLKAPSTLLSDITPQMRKKYLTRCAKDAPQIYGPENLKRTLAVPCVLGGVLDTSRFNPQALKAWTQSVLGSFADGHDYYAQARIAGVYADINFPADYFFNGWEWEPQQGD